MDPLSFFHFSINTAEPNVCYVVVLISLFHCQLSFQQSKSMTLAD
jgi:hypothetical protein